VLLPEPVIIRILCYDLNLTMKWLIDETKKRTWQLYGHEVREIQDRKKRRE
jgi:hypothetical protein